MVQQAAWADISGNGREEPVIYYKRRDGWIVWNGTQASLQMNMLRKGCVPLSQFGRIKFSEDHWGPILRHPDGPKEFPVEQILAFRWYRKDMLPDLRPIVQQGRDFVRENVPQPRVVFPQLKGMKITEFPCPENCKINTMQGQSVDKFYHSPIDLGNHLRVMHGYDRAEIIKYGEAMGIDFSKVPGGKTLVQHDFTADEVLEPEPLDEYDFEVTPVSASSPAAAEVAQQFEVDVPANNCPDCGWENKKGTEQGLAVHKRLHCKKQLVTA